MRVHIAHALTSPEVKPRFLVNASMIKPGTDAMKGAILALIEEGGITCRRS
jgi:hypothetical protein